MEFILYIIGFIIGIILFLYALSFYESGKVKIKKRFTTPSQRDETSRIRVNPQAVSYEEMSGLPRERICPLCGAVLKKYEALYAAQVESEMGKKILIYGCRYCYKPDEDPDARRRSKN